MFLLYSSWDILTIFVLKIRISGTWWYECGTGMKNGGVMRILTCLFEFDWLHFVCVFIMWICMCVWVFSIKFLSSYMSVVPFFFCPSPCCMLKVLIFGRRDNMGRPDKCRLLCCKRFMYMMHVSYMKYGNMIHRISKINWMASNYKFLPKRKTLEAAVTFHYIHMG